MDKVKSNKFSWIFSLLKCCLIGILATLIGTLLFAIVLKFVDFSSKTISYVNDGIKMISLFITIGCIKKVDGEKLLIKSVLAGLIYALLTFVIFSVLNGGFNFNLTFVYDLIFALVVSVIISVILNLFNKR